MTSSIYKDIDALLEQYRTGDVMIKNKIISTSYEWIQAFAEREVNKSHNDITDEARREAKNISVTRINTKIKYWSPDDIAQEVGERFTLNFEKMQIVSSTDLYSKLSLMTFQVLSDKLKALLTGQRENHTLHGVNSLDEIIQPIDSIESVIGENELLVSLLDKFNKTLPIQTRAFVMRNLDDMATEDIALVLNKDKRTIQSYVKTINALLKMELTNR